MTIIWTIIIGFIAGVIAKFLHPGDNEPSGFILTTILGIVGASSPPGWGRPWLVRPRRRRGLHRSHRRRHRPSGDLGRRDQKARLIQTLSGGRRPNRGPAADAEAAARAGLFPRRRLCASGSDCGGNRMLPPAVGRGPFPTPVGPVQRYRCPSCHQEIFFRNTACLACGIQLLFDPDRGFSDMAETGHPCANRGQINCNWSADEPGACACPASIRRWCRTCRFPPTSTGGRGSRP